jgi:hypothetical protein
MQRIGFSTGLMQMQLVPSLDRLSIAIQISHMCRGIRRIGRDQNFAAIKIL